MAKKVFLVLFLLMLADTVSAAIVHGTVYDTSLDKVVDVRLEVDTTPKQTYISKDGDYEFNVPVVTYTITANYYESGYLEYSASEEIVIKESGTYVLDLVLFPSFDEETELIDENDEISVGEINGGRSPLAYVLFGFLVLIALAALVYLIRRKKPGKKKEEKKEVKDAKSDLDKIVKIIRQEGGRITQKELRQHFPLSEAKMSLMITELEHKGTVKRIKKGRGNIIILN